jgi:predicted glycogen debranching enzyme
VLALQKRNSTQILSTRIRNGAIEELLSKEWLLTNERGSYASSTIIGCNTRSYHGLLIGSLNPPANRMMALANCLEMLIVEGKTFSLSTFEFPGRGPSDNDKFAPAGFGYIRQFRRDSAVHFDYELDSIKLTKSIYLLRDSDIVAIVYDFTSIERAAEFVLRPFVGLRDFHTLQKSYARLRLTQLRDGLLIRHDLPGSCELLLSCPAMKFESDQQWWFNFVYRNDRERGQSFNEDLWTPGFFKCAIERPTEITLWANLSRRCQPEQWRQMNIATVKKDLRQHQSSLITAARNRNGKFKILCVAADQFITKRQPGQDNRATILAGFPWFGDWGRDAFVALPGLLLSTRRFDEATSVLTTFAQAVDDGMIPNRFDDRGDTAYFNSVDASLWFINAAFQYLNATADMKTFTQQLLPTIRWVIDYYHKGTRFGIHADKDGLITAGSSDTQLTWMDAKYDGVAFTPRAGKAVEVNALWHNSLRLVAQFYARRNGENANRYKEMADRVAESFCELFWNEQCGYLNDTVLPDGSADSSLRPNQIFAVSLPFPPPLLPQQRRSVVEIVQKELLTPYGLRTLSTKHSQYKGTYTGPQFQRDEAYHQGTVWPWLMGPFVEAYLKVNEFSRQSKKEAAQFIQPLLEHLTESGCLGSVSEIFDGDAPHKPRGCIAQAWSVSELIRAYQLVNS